MKNSLLHCVNNYNDQNLSCFVLRILYDVHVINQSKRIVVGEASFTRRYKYCACTMDIDRTVELHLIETKFSSMSN